tara:strand:- start:8141 stop:10063 length:1923 start_codon:yes stop_codon:yes gene_type:complete
LHYIQSFGKMKSIYTIILLLFSFQLVAQDTIVKKAPLQGFNISGNYRFFTQHRLFTNPYAFQVLNDQPQYLSKRTILVGDASQLPELTLNIGGSPSKGTSFGTDLVIWNQNNGDFDYYHNLQLGINLYGNFKTKFANIGVKAGGIHWHSMTAFTMKSFSGYNRYSIFDRNPWDPQFKELNKRYEDYYKNGAISQDTRWAQQAVQGFILDLTELPLGISANFMYGKTQNAGAAFIDPANISYDSTSNNFIKFYDNTIPNNVIAGSIKKTFNKHRISLNSFNRKTYSNALATEEISNQVLTSEFYFSFDKFSLLGEVGAGHYKDVYKDLGIGEMVSLKVNLKKSLTKIPIEIHYFRINPDVVNNNAEFVNTSVVEATSAAAGTSTVIGANGVLQQNGSAMLGMGQMANNRQGLNINTEFKIKEAIVSIGNGFSKEIRNENKSITYGHAINGLTMSRFWRWSFPANVGPYNSTSVLFRNVFQTLNLTDLDNQGAVVNDKHFNNIEAQVKYKINLFGNPWHLFYLGSYNSIQKKFSPVTVFNEEAYLRYYSHQLESYYKLHPKVILSQYLGWERVIANYDTEVDIESNRPRNQEGFAFGLGIDYLLAKNTAIYLRHRYFTFKDRNFALDQFAGHETTLELKIIF